jgi:hypothetical protein
VKNFIITLFVSVLFTTLGYSQSGWVNLFSGENLDGWEIKQGKANFKILSDGVIQGTSVLNSPSTYLCSKNYYDDLKLMLVRD